MPTYVYRCLECDDKFEVQQSFTDDALTVCICEKAAPVRKVFTPVGVTFKGSGFYKNDSRGSSSKSSSAGSSSSSSTSSDKSDTTKAWSSSDSSSSGSSSGSSSSGSSSSGSSSSSSSGSDAG